MEIPFNRPSFDGKESEFVSRSLQSGVTSGGGPYAAKAERLLKEQIEGGSVLLTTSCTHALEMAAILLDIEKGDEVIVPSFTFVSTALAFFMRGAKIVFVDIRPDTLNMDERLLERLITKKTRAIIPVHYAGYGCDMVEIMRIARKYDIAVVEDNAHGLYGRHRGDSLGSIGHFATQSFHETKNITCGEGGALVINDERYVSRAEIIRDKGTDRAKYFRGHVDKYSWVDKGSSYVMSDITASILYAQLLDRERIQGRRKEIWSYYCRHLVSWAAQNEIQLPLKMSENEHPFHMFFLIFPDRVSRDDFIGYMKKNGISVVFHYVPLHESSVPGVADSRYECPVSSDISERLVRLPMFRSLSDAELQYIVKTIHCYEHSYA